ncbi:MAG TPA: EF-hand domain-containing protein [Pseudomonas sp.]|nr:EF-hand domain-containing protein [Pseudomonas sp.]
MSQQGIKAVFNMIDKDRDGKISLEDFNSAIGNLSEALDRSDFDAQFSKLADKDGKINLEDFTALFSPPKK